MINRSKLKLTENHLEEIIKDPNNQNWMNISYTYILSEDFLRKFKDYVDWFYVSRNQELSISFLKEFESYIDWGEISYCQKLSKFFIIEFWDKLDFDYLLHNKNLGQEVKDFIKVFK